MIAELIMLVSLPINLIAHLFISVSRHQKKTKKAQKTKMTHLPNMHTEKDLLSLKVRNVRVQSFAHAIQGFILLLKSKYILLLVKTLLLRFQVAILSQ